MTIRFHKGDLTSASPYATATSIAIDTETLGLNPHRDRLCVVQLSSGDGTADVVQIIPNKRPENLLKLLQDPSKTKLFHFARFDVAVFFAQYNVVLSPIYCTKIASRLTRTYTDRHGLKDLSKELIGVDMNKQQQSSDWGADSLTDAQLDYAASDVLHLHALKTKLDMMLKREGREQLAANCFKFLETRAVLDIKGWGEEDIFSHSSGKS